MSGYVVAEAVRCSGRARRVHLCSRAAASRGGGRVRWAAAAMSRGRRRWAAETVGESAIGQFGEALLRERRAGAIAAEMCEPFPVLRVQVHRCVQREAL